MKASIIKSIDVLLIVLWVYAALSKLLDYEESRRQMLNQVFPIFIANILLWAVPLSELTAAGLLCFQRTRRAGLKLSLLLLLLFTGYIGLVMLNVFGRVPCSCGGILEQMTWGQHLAFNLLFVFLLVFALFFYPRTSQTKKVGLSSGPNRPYSAADKKSGGLRPGYGQNSHEKLPRIRAPADKGNEYRSEGGAAP